jgi:pimeloyl-ACP methyl ester carboxylesterase
VQVLYLHGFASGPDSVKSKYFAKKLQDVRIKYQILDLNLDDFSTLTPTKALKYIKSLIKNEETILIGSSLGGLYGLIIAEQEQMVRKLILLAPALEINSLWDDIIGADNLKKWKTEGSLPIYHYGYGQIIPLDYSFLADLAKYEDHGFLRQIPALVFHGINDITIPYRVSQRYVNGNAAAIFHQLGSNHSLEDSLAYIWQHSVNFIGAVSGNQNLI